MSLIKVILKSNGTFKHIVNQSETPLYVYDFDKIEHQFYQLIKFLPNNFH